jgi:GT2 family glycosyltransferase/glycosyltransferase involved in cell wall biosynthesis
VTDDGSELEELAAERDELRREVTALRDEQQRLLAQLDALHGSASDTSNRDAPYAELTRLRSEVYSASEDAQEARRRLYRLRRSRSVRAAIWISARGRRARHLVRRVADRIRPSRPAAGSTLTKALPAPRLEQAAPPLDVELQTARLERLAARPPVSVIIPIFNAFDELGACLASLERNTIARDVELVLVDDASTDRRIAPLLDEWEQRDGVRVLRNETNLGFTRTINRGFESTAGDVVILNSDCEVTPRWLQNLADCALRDARIATVTPVSDNAGAFSVPEIGVPNDHPAHLTRDEVGRLVTRTSGRVFPTAPTGNGFCMYIKRAVIDEIGPFDAEHFPRGYGEEGDFCMRARAAGWVNVIDDTTIVFHHRSASFGPEKDELLRAGRAQLDARHPEYTALVRSFVRSDDLAQVRANVRDAYARSASLPQRIRPRILYVHHRGTGGAIETNADLMGALLDSFEPYVLTSDTGALELSRVGPAGNELLERWELPERLTPERFTDPRYRAIVATLLTRYCIDLVHIRLLLAHTFDLPSVARALDIPVILSFHDYFLVCPSVHLLDDADRFCGGACTAGDGACRIPSDWVKGIPHLKHAWVNVWQEQVGNMLGDVDAFVTTSPNARDIHLRTYPQLSDAQFHLIEHGRDLAFRPVEAPADLRAPIRIAIPGALDVHKGAGYIEQLVALDEDKLLEFHFLGRVPDEYQHLGVMHGRYERDEFATIMREIQPTFVGILSIWAETYSHTLTEAWAAGIPVLVTDLGAQKERVDEHGGGWVLSHDDPRQAYERILQICRDEDEYWRVRAQTGSRTFRTLRAMALDYELLYRSTLFGRRSIQRPDQPKPPRVPRAAVFVNGGIAGPHQASTYVRMFRRLDHPLVREQLGSSIVDLDAFINGTVDDSDLAIVQRTAVPPPLLGEFLGRVRRRNIPLVVDVDDNLFALEATDERYAEYEAHLTSLKELIGAADLVTVSTEVLREVMEDHSARAALVPNMLDEFLWFGDSPSAHRMPVRVRAREWLGSGRDIVQSFRRDHCNLVYIGTKTHAEDLAILRPVMRRLREQHEIDFTLLVIGGEEANRAERWYRRITIPPGCTTYAEFVSWLRSRAGSWDIALAPLCDTEFNRSKSDLKFLEYSGLGLPGVFSKVVPYQRTIADGSTGVLAPNTTDAWCEAILRLARDPAAREQIATAATKYVLEHRCLKDDVGYARLVSESHAASPDVP